MEKSIVYAWFGTSLLDVVASGEVVGWGLMDGYVPVLLWSLACNTRLALGRGQEG